MRVRQDAAGNDRDSIDKIAPSSVLHAWHLKRTLAGGSSPARSARRRRISSQHPWLRRCRGQWRGGTGACATPRSVATGSAENSGGTHRDSDEMDAVSETTEHNGENEAGSTSGVRRSATKTGGKPRRAMAALGRGRSVIVIGHDLTFDRWIKTLQEALAKARRAKTYGLELESFLKMLADVARQ